MFKKIALSEAQQLDYALNASEEILQMDEQSFRMLYERTARPLWSYLYRVSGNATLADDLMQEAYYRILRAHLAEMNQEYAKNYLLCHANLLCPISIWPREVHRPAINDLLGDNANERSFHPSRRCTQNS